jgi:hypothetical protein
MDNPVAKRPTVVPSIRRNAILVAFVAGEITGIVLVALAGLLT